MRTCKRCGTELHLDRGVWVDTTEGEGCTDDYGVDGTHVPDSTMRKALSSNAFSHDDQIADVLSYASTAYPETMDRFTSDFPEYNHLEWSGSWVDTQASGVDPDYMSWVADWVEANLPVVWDDGEPFDTSDDLGTCAWYLKCDNAATHTQSHPVLGDVPICDRCQAKYDSM